MVRHARYRAILIPASLIAAAAGLIIGAACAPLYTPNAVHTPLMDSAGEVHAQAYFGTSTFSFNAATSITDHLMLTGAYSFDPIEDSLTTVHSLLHVGHWFWEGGAGWYTPIGRRTRLELIGGFGTGRAVSTSSDSLDTFRINNYRVDGRYHRVSAQVNIGYRESKHSITMMSLDGSWRSIELRAGGGFALRASYVWFDRVERSPLEPLEASALFFEPVFFARNGWRNLQAELQVGFSVKAADNGLQFRSQWLFFNAGIHFILDGLW